MVSGLKLRASLREPRHSMGISTGQNRLSSPNCCRAGTDRTTRDNTYRHGLPTAKSIGHRAICQVSLFKHYKLKSVGRSHVAGHGGWPWPAGVCRAARRVCANRAVSRDEPSVRQGVAAGRVFLASTPAECLPGRRRVRLCSPPRPFMPTGRPSADGRHFICRAAATPPAGGHDTTRHDTTRGPRASRSARLRPVRRHTTTHVTCQYR